MKWTLGIGLAAGSGLAALLAAGCGGGSAGDAASVGVRSGSTNLVRVDYGRLVDVFSWERKVQGQAGRDAANRREVLYQRDTLIDPALLSDLDTYVLREVDPVTGRAELLIRWDRDEESTQFATALASAEGGVQRIEPGRFDQNTGISPFDMVPRNAALKLTFGANLALPADYFLVNPGAIQLLEITGNPETDPPASAFRTIPVRLVARGDAVLIDPVIVGEESSLQPGLRANPLGMPASPNAKGASIRLAIPAEDRIGAFPIKVAGDVIGTGKDRTGNVAVIRDFRAGSSGDAHQGFLFDQEPPRVVGEFQFGILAVNTQANTLTLNKRARLVTLRSLVAGAGGRPGDAVVQEVLSPGTGERVRIKAEIDDPTLQDSGTNAVVTVRVNTLEGYDSKGNAVSFQASGSPLGQDCKVRVILESEKDDASLFLSFSPETALATPSQYVDPFASVALSFSEPVSTGNLSAFDTMVLTTSNNPVTVRDAKLGTPTLIVASAVPDPLTAMSVRLVTPLGFNHEKGQTETVVLMVMAQDKGKALTDLAGNRIDLRSTKNDALVASFTLNKDAESNPVVNIARRFLSADEDGTPADVVGFGPVVDGWGQFSQKESKLIAAPTVRFFRDAEETTLRAITRGDKGECLDNGVPMGGFPLYLTPRNVIQGVTGGVQEPFNPKGSREQMTYREDDFQLSYTDASDMELDLEQLYWASFLGNPINYDVFDRCTLKVSHCERRPDLAAEFQAGAPGSPPSCAAATASYLSGLQATFQENVLDGDQQKIVFEDVVYEMNPNNAFKNSQGILFLPYPKFQKTYTWRDRRLSTWDTVNDRAVGLGGIATPGGELTTHVPSPWYDLNPAVGNGLPLEMPHVDSAFRGDVVDGLHPVALPLLLDFMVYPDDPNRNGGLAKGLNQAFIAVVWALWPGGLIPHGYYYAPGGVPGRFLPGMRAHTSGGTDNTSREILVDPKNSPTALGGWVVDPLLGLHQAPPVDCHVPWARADFLRRVSIVTFGFVDLTKPNKNKITGVPSDGAPVWGSTYRPVAYEMVTEPALDQVAGGTSAQLEWRGVDTLPNDLVYDPAAASVADKRGNLLNPLYACDAYRLAAITGHVFTIDAKGFTRYETDPQKLLVNGFGQRYVNWRVIFQNNITAVPPVSPALDSVGLAVRLAVKP